MERLAIFDFKISLTSKILISPKHHIEIKTLFSEKLKAAFSEILPFGQQKKIEKGMYVVE